MALEFLWVSNQQVTVHSKRGRSGHTSQQTVTLGSLCHPFYSSGLSSFMMSLLFFLTNGDVVSFQLSGRGSFSPYMVRPRCVVVSKAHGGETVIYNVPCVVFVTFLVIVVATLILLWLQYILLLSIPFVYIACFCIFSAHVSLF